MHMYALSLIHVFIILLLIQHDAMVKHSTVDVGVAVMREDV